MMFPSHLLGTILLALMLSRIRPFEPKDWLLAAAFGVLIDLDHLLQFPGYLLAHGLQGLDPQAMLQHGAAWQGFMHRWWAGFIVLAACVAFRSYVPAAFWLLHMFQDFVIATRYVRFGSPTEWAIVGALFAVVLLLLAWEHRGVAQRPAFGRFAVARLGLAGILLKR